MATLNPLQLMQMLKRGNPRWVAMNLVQQNYPNDPTAQNLIQMAERGDTQNLERVVGNMLGAQGKNFSAEMQNLLNGVRNFQ